MERRGWILDCPQSRVIRLTQRDATTLATIATISTSDGNLFSNYGSQHLYGDSVVQMFRRWTGRL
jgi:hypothetical protein